LHAVDDCRRYKNNSSSVLSSIDKRIKEDCGSEVGIVHSLFNDRVQWTRHKGKGFGKRVCQLITVESSMTGDPLESQSYTGGNSVGKGPSIQKDSG